MSAFARSSDPSTSHEAAARVDFTNLEAIALQGLEELGGRGTAKQVAAQVGRDKWSISPRFKPLEGKGKVARTEERHRGQIVWELVR